MDKIDCWDFFDLPEINVVDGCVFFEAVNKSKVLEQVLSIFDVLGDELSNAVEMW